MGATSQNRRLLWFSDVFTHFEGPVGSGFFYTYNVYFLYLICNHLKLDLDKSEAEYCCSKFCGHVLAPFTASN
jgi:hypothetical protein